MITYVKRLALYGLSRFQAKMYASLMDVAMDTMPFLDNQDVSLVTLNAHFVKRRVIIAKAASQITS